MISEANMDTSIESDSDNETVNEAMATETISQSEVKNNYRQAGTFISEDKDTISLDKHADMIDHTCAAILDKVQEDLSLPYDLSDFQKLSINMLMQLKDLVLISPTGSGKVCSLLLF